MVLQLAREQRADLIILTTHGQAGQASAAPAMGSVADTILKGASVPLLLVPPRSMPHVGRQKAAPASDIPAVAAGRAA
jgi:hypothetical protein